MTSLRFSGGDVIVLLLVLSCLARLTQEWIPPSHDHGGVLMGVPADGCDDAQWNLELDWDFTTDYEYKCQPYEDYIPVKKTSVRYSCLANEDIPPPIHECMTKHIRYKDLPPRGGPHRPLWPVYGDYRYVPPQRWVHSLEHGAVVFLYHPCANRSEIDLLKEIADLCLRRHVTTPYRLLPRDQPFALVTYGCKLTMSHVRIEDVVQFIRGNAFNPKRASEYDNWKNGQYSFQLVKPARVVPGSDMKDSNLCPGILESDSI